MSTLTQPIKWHGGKSYLAKRILALAPPRCKNPNAPAADDPGYLHYVEPYAGGLSVLLENDPEGISEVVADINADITNFWAVLRQPHAFEQFKRHVEAIPCSEFEYEEAMARIRRDDPTWGLPRWERAAWFFVAVRQSLAARMKGFTPLAKTRTRRGMNELPSAWLTAVEGLPAVHARLSRVVILRRHAIEVIEQQDGPRTWFYLDPPYLHETRATTGEYAHEMTHDQHESLLALLGTIKGRFALSGYRSELYDEAAKCGDWHRTDIEIPNHAAGGKEKRRMTECVWTNYKPEAP